MNSDFIFEVDERQHDSSSFDDKLKPTLAIVTEEELNNKKESTLYRDSIQPCMFFWHSFLQGDNYFA